jgi:NADPH:quinone reductase-like Zn-dependent oxidoreductase
MADAMMHAIVVHEFGESDQLKYEEVARPTPGAGEVLVRVHAAGVNPIDWKFRKGLLAALRGFELPWTPGSDIAGVVESVGPGVERLRPGDEVLGQSKSGAYAEYATAIADQLAQKPKRLSWDEAASLPVGANTAWQGLFDHGGLQPGQRVLVQGAAGGVGQLAAQLAHWKGAHVIGTASASNLDFVRSLGAEEVVDYTTTKVEDVLSGLDLVFDTIGGATYEASLKTLRRGGAIISLVGAPPEEGAAALGVRLIRMNAKPRGDELRTVAELVESGTIQVSVGEAFPLAEAWRAHEQSEHGHGRGRIILHAVA